MSLLFIYKLSGKMSFIQCTPKITRNKKYDFLCRCTPKPPRKNAIFKRKRDWMILGFHYENMIKSIHKFANVLSLQVH